MVVGGLTCCDGQYSSQTTCQPQRNVQLLIYNRVPKAGSTSVLQRVNLTNVAQGGNVFEMLAIHNTDNFKQSGNRARALSPEWRESMVDYIMSHAEHATATRPLFVHGHFLFYDFYRHVQKQGKMPPTTAYMNILRHPVTKLVSHFQYLQSAFRGSKRARSGLSFDPDVTIDACVSAIASTPPYKPTWEAIPNTTLPCDGTFFMRAVQWRYFCGYARECLQADIEPGLTMAKENLRKHFAFVGLLEETHLTYRALETLFPTFFARGSGGISAPTDEELEQIANKNPEKYKTTRATRRYIAAWAELSGDMDFYHFAASLFWDKITCLIARQWRAGHTLNDLTVLSAD
ncbi:hypothetical protein PTSG_02803 [Salpingoeca rosetta]|uniref:Uncharacterized protein n=1 Tax=Salpingoeca rosetta (strain ATCC 50818 / BSB-021) TaxID=946362 RepID=F2U3D5_SALR5|nr:uncharacterized protein PTSG_02803 [Salpingoeca rosetta]EGD82129.1 hypothetical protein PTSG_02803 [Salpingoeca rosetta]|eukprot:XP_004996312.1 hypothetical protein PTSG_02803 [Salpingoeca rosetta]